LDAELGQAVVWGASAGFGALALAVVGLAIYIFRESGRQMREAAQRVNFVNQVSHELKTPLTNIRMYAELLEDGLEDEEDKLRGQAQVIAQESQRLSRLIGNVLSFARQQRGKLTARRQPGKVDDVVRQVLDQFGPSLEDKGIEVELETGAPAEVLLDSDVVGQILGNLLGNVEKYAAQGGRVEIRTAQKEGQSEIWVTDHGPGVPTRARDKIFKPFFRLSGKVTDGVSGTGIGLAIAQDLARLHGGELSLEPRQVGACFKVSLSTPAKEKGGER
jgi:signal transduction histidine kinase